VLGEIAGAQQNRPVSNGFTRLANPAHIKPRVGKPDSRAVSAVALGS
jgi:hypothetical protein